MYIIGKDDPEEVRKKMHNENFENLANVPVLRDVYNIMNFLENYEKSKQKSKKEAERMLKTDIYKPNNPLLSKSMVMTKSQNFSETDTLGDKST